jgi:oligopeptide/dipeptide ABC transporter ATP-binding protein
MFCNGDPINAPGASPRPASATPLLDVEDLEVQFRVEGGSVYAVNGVSFEIHEAETVGFVGESGCGKSATALALMGLLPKPTGRITDGTIVLEGRELTSLRERELRSLRGAKLAMIFQDPSSGLNPVLRIEEQMTEGIRTHRRVPARVARSRAHELLAQVAIPEPSSILRAYPHQLSGGMRQRIMIAIALALEPVLLIADEPTTALDVTIQAQVLELIKTLSRESGTAVLLITHDLGIVAGMADRVHVMYAGHVVEERATRELFSDPRHPYTIGLLHSLPRIDRGLVSFRPIEGAPPNQRRIPVGCPFVPRCPWKLDVCSEEMPLLEPVSARDAAAPVHARASQRVACHAMPTKAEAEAGRPSPVAPITSDSREG